ncbi:MAG: pantetheine-phosphate adenylyltransferase [Deferribacterota bacterium]|nr:pantetheine-phosphate adenylyltransferase [Deferribacterota bacterium]
MDILYPGTFDPITNGHLDVIERASKIFKKIIVAVAKSYNKKPMFSLELRESFIKESIKDLNNVEVRSFDCLLVDYLKKTGVHNILRSLRVASDFEYELQLALMNRKLDEQCETVFLMPNQNYIFLSSSMIREIAMLGGDIECFVPKPVYDYITRNFKAYK